jgi:mannosyltransferase OCH1-like enzyme
MIPRLLSQTWKSTRLPPAAARLRDTWIEKNPDFECRLFDDEASRAVIAEVVPEHVEAYDALPHAVMRADIFRYAVIYRDGGLYADVDMECLKPVSTLLARGACLLAVEAHLTATRAVELGYPALFQIANCVFAAAPRHAFFMAAIRRAFALAQTAPNAGRDMVEDITGPRMLSRLFFEAVQSDGAWNDVALAPQITLMAPLNYPNIWPLSRNMFARHHTFGTWKSAGPHRSAARIWIERNRLVSPFPAALVEPACEVLKRYRTWTRPRPC